MCAFSCLFLSLASSWWITNKWKAVWDSSENVTLESYPKELESSHHNFVETRPQLSNSFFCVLAFSLCNGNHCLAHCILFWWVVRDMIGKSILYVCWYIVHALYMKDIIITHEIKLLEGRGPVLVMFESPGMPRVQQAFSTNSLLSWNAHFH